MTKIDSIFGEMFNLVFADTSDTALLSTTKAMRDRYNKLTTAERASKAGRELRQEFEVYINEAKRRGLIN